MACTEIYHLPYFCVFMCHGLTLKDNHYYNHYFDHFGHSFVEHVSILRTFFFDFCQLYSSFISILSFSALIPCPSSTSPLLEVHDSILT